MMIRLIYNPSSDNLEDRLVRTAAVAEAVSSAAGDAPQVGLSEASSIVLKLDKACMSLGVAVSGGKKHLVIRSADDFSIVHKNSAAGFSESEKEFSGWRNISAEDVRKGFFGKSGRDFVLPER